MLDANESGYAALSDRIHQEIGLLDLDQANARRMGADWELFRLAGRAETLASVLSWIRDLE